MTVFELLKGVDCGCGRRHECPIENVVIGKNAFESLPGLCRESEKILLVCDENTYAAAGKNAEAVLGPQVSEKIVFPGSSVLIPDERAIEAVKARTAGKDLLLGAGSGVIQDLCKYVSKETGIPYMIVATAPSMDGYASDGAAMILGGMKVTVKAGLPKAILADTGVLKNAPKEMIRSGFGDIMGKYSALCDWKLSALVTGEYFCPFIYEETYETVRRVRELSGRIFSGDGESIAVLMEALVKVGIMMSFAGTSRPASGSEHHLSHFFEITGIEKKVPYFAHGIDVGYSTVITQRLREELLTLPAWPARPVFDRKAWVGVKAVLKEAPSFCGRNFLLIECAEDTVIPKESLEVLRSGITDGRFGNGVHRYVLLPTDHGFNSCKFTAAKTVIGYCREVMNNRV